MAQLRVLAIFQLAVVIPHRWLSAHSGSLEEYNFGAADMAWAVDLLYDEVVERPQRFLEDNFMIDGMWAPIANTIPPFQDFLTHLYAEHSSKNISHLVDNEKTLPYNELRQALF